MRPFDHITLPPSDVRLMSTATSSTHYTHSHDDIIIKFAAAFIGLSVERLETYRIVVEESHRLLALQIFDVDDLVLGVDAVTVVVERHLARQAVHFARLQIVENALACVQRQTLQSASFELRRHT